MTIMIGDTDAAALSRLDIEEKALWDMLYKSAEGGSVEAAMFILVNRHGYRTTGELNYDAA